MEVRSCKIGVKIESSCKSKILLRRNGLNRGFDAKKPPKFNIQIVYNRFCGCLYDINYKTMTKVPVVIKITPTIDFSWTGSFKKIKASTIVIMMLSLSIGTTLDTGPIWIAL